jgi:hypothetical protein
MVLVWNLKPGESRTGWIVRPYRAYAADLPELRQRNWSQEVETAKQEWHALLDRAAQFQVPDPGVASSFRACLADLFIMREPVAGGSIAAVPGTKVYRAANSGEATIVAVALDQMGLHVEAVPISSRRSTGARSAREIIAGYPASPPRHRGVAGACSTFCIPVTSSRLNMS